LFKGAQNIYVRQYLYILLSFFFFACSKQEDAPHQFSSYDYRMDGSWFIPNIGVPSSLNSVAIGDTLSSATLMTAPVPLMNAEEFTYAISAGNRIIIGNEKTSKILAAFPDAAPVIELLTDNNAIYAIHIDGKIDALDHEGKSLWQADVAGYATTHSVLSEYALVTVTEAAVMAIDIKTGKNLWSYNTGFTTRSLIYDSKEKNVIAMLSGYNKVGIDSIICFSADGKIKSRFGFSGIRIISNICLCGKEKNNIAFGYLHERQGDSERTMHVAVYSGLEKGDVKKISDHVISYFATKISSNGPIVLSGGFYSSGSHLESGIDAFSADDTTKLWQRRFTELVVTPVAASNKYVYFTLTFSTDAIVPAKTIFYTLDISTGKALGELPIAGSGAIVNGIPMPMNESGFMLANPVKPIIYFLKP
jgi:outer membrane protein assembly factor BamB